MLVLSRKSSQTIRINDQIVITILRVKGRSVQVGIEAPEHVQILRGELIQQALAESLPANTLPECAATSDQQASSEAPVIDVWEDFAALYMADGDVTASFIDPDENEDLPVEPRQASQLPPTRILPLRRLERRFPMGGIRPAAQR